MSITIEPYSRPIIINNDNQLQWIYLEPSARSDHRVAVCTPGRARGCYQRERGAGASERVRGRERVKVREIQKRESDRVRQRVRQRESPDADGNVRGGPALSVSA